MGKENVYIVIGHTNNLEDIVLQEASQAQKGKYCLISLVYEM
jgi:hypothetical protein